MTDPSLLIPAIIAFSLLLVGLGLTWWEFKSGRNIGQAPLDHTPTVIKPSPDQVRSEVDALSNQ